MRLIIVLSLLFLAVAAMSPAEEACATLVMKKLSTEQDIEVKRFVNKCFKLLNRGRKDEVIALVRSHDQAKVARFLEEYMVGECAIYRQQFGKK